MIIGSYKWETRAGDKYVRIDGTCDPDGRVHLQAVYEGDNELDLSTFCAAEREGLYAIVREHYGICNFCLGSGQATDGATMKSVGCPKCGGRQVVWVVETYDYSDPDHSDYDTDGVFTTMVKARERAQVLAARAAATEQSHNYWEALTWDCEVRPVHLDEDPQS